MNIVIGIAGGTGSGKTTIAHKVYQAFRDDAVILSHDYYYKAHEEMPFEEREIGRASCRERVSTTV